ncbi:MAG TPA: branched-chain amino acid ABC transporter permease [Gaiellaceae bacterium]|nr:branched-chain amino acid ABC transporter permease [Gaiellaceae bacterium]
MSVQAGSREPSRLDALRGRKRPEVVSLIGILFVVLIVVWLIRNFVHDPQEFISVSLIGLTTGAVYGLIALGYTLVYGILQLINFAHGDVFALSGLISSSIMVDLLNLSGGDAAVVIAAGLFTALVLTMAFGATINTSIEFLAYRRLRSQPRLTMLISAVGMSFIVQNISLALYDVNYRPSPGLIPTTPAFTIGEISYSWNKLSVVLITIPVLIGLTWLVRNTKQGKAMRATAQDQDAAAMMGINVNRTISFTFTLAGALAGAAGVLYLLQFNMRYDTGFELGLIAFTSAVLGGIGNLAGAALGGLLIGFIQAYNEGFTIWAPGSDWTRSIVFGILIAILVLRPEGLLGERTPEGG